MSRRTLRVEWGDCDPADIVFYPQYLRWFDACTTSLFENVGLPLKGLFTKHGVIGIPIVDLKVKFMAPSRFGDELIAESKITEWRKSSFLVQHQLFNRGTLAVEGVETRVWTGADPNNSGGMKSRAVPREIVDKLSMAADAPK